LNPLANGPFRPRSPGEPEIRNPKVEGRNKSKLMGMGQWANGKPRRFFASGEESWRHPEGQNHGETES
jgi:hypothetical protein